jgi:hypothetical protein
MRVIRARGWRPSTLPEGVRTVDGVAHEVDVLILATHIVRCLRRARGTGATLVEVKREANDRYFRKMLGRRRNQIFFRGTCENANSYYFDRHGDVPFRASPTLEVAWRSARFDLDDYRFERVAPEPVAP